MLYSGRLFKGEIIIKKKLVFFIVNLKVFVKKFLGVFKNIKERDFSIIVLFFFVYL